MSGKLKILIPTDFSADAKHAADVVLQMFSKSEAEYRLINVYSEPGSSADMLVSIVDLLEKESNKELDKEIIRLRELFPEASDSISATSEYGELSQVIKKLVLEESIDFVVMGTKGASGIKRVLLGSNTAHVIQQRICPVIAIPSASKASDLKKVVIAFDAIAFDDDQFLPLERLMDDREAEYHLLHISAGEFDIKEKIHNLNGDLDAFTQNFDFDATNVENTDVVEGILDYSHNEEMDLLVMIHRKHNIFDKLFHQSISKQIAMRTDLPLLVLPEK